MSKVTMLLTGSMTMALVLSGCGFKEATTKPATTQSTYQRKNLQMQANQVTNHYLDALAAQKSQGIGTQQKPSSDIDQAVAYANYIYMISDPNDRDYKSIRQQLETGQIDNAIDKTSAGYGYFDARTAQQASHQIHAAAKRVADYNVSHPGHPLNLASVRA